MPQMNTRARATVGKGMTSLASLGVVWFVVREGHEAWKGEECCDEGCG
jgi:hypothetical protein